MYPAAKRADINQTMEFRFLWAQSDRVEICHLLWVKKYITEH